MARKPRSKKKVTKKQEPEITLEELQDAADEINDILAMEPEIETEFDEVNDLIDEIKENCVIDGDVKIYTTDKLSQETFDILEAIGIVAASPPEDDEDPGDEDPDDEDPDDEDPDDEDPGDEDPENGDEEWDEMAGKLEGMNLKEMREFCKEEKIKVGRITKANKEEKIDQILDQLFPEGDDEDPDDEDKPAEKKPAAKKPAAKKPAAKKPAVKKAGKPGQPGVIASIIECIKEKGPVSKDEILAFLMKRFPDREEKSMKSTIGVQVPGRINRERDFDVEVVDGKVQVVGAAPKKKAGNKKAATKKTAKKTAARRSRKK